jgi:hypothetical protein
MEEIFVDFEKDLQEVKKTIELFKNLDEFAQKPHLNLSESDDDFIQTSIELSEGIKLNRRGNTRIPTILMLYVAGRFENYAKTIMEETSTQIAKLHETFKTLPNKFQESLINDTSKVVQNPRKYNHGEGARDSFIKNLYHNIHDDNLDIINYQCISITERNMRADVITELFSKINYKNIWDDICSQANIRQQFGGADVSKTAKECKRTLNTFMDMRNNVAHSSGAITWISKEKGNDYISFFIEFGRAMKDVCPIHIAQSNNA